MTKCQLPGMSQTIKVQLSPHTQYKFFQTTKASRLISQTVTVQRQKFYKRNLALYQYPIFFKRHLVCNGDQVFSQKYWQQTV